MDMHESGEARQSERDAVRQSMPSVADAVGDSWQYVFFALLLLLLLYFS